jgi:methionyl-tRNA formyltransferase
MRILFWGTPSFATPSLRALLGEGFDVVAVVTQPDKPQGRSRSRLVPSPVKEIATAEGIAVLQPARPRGTPFLEQIRSLEPEASVVVAYGHILVPEVIDLPRRGTYNVHASLLPALRGAAPIQAAIREGLSETGVSVMRVVPALDAGPVVLQLATPIASDETAGELQLRLSELGAQALIEGLALIQLGAAREVPQDDARATYAPKIDRDAAQIDWTLPAAAVARQIRAYDPRPGAFTLAPTGEVKLFGARALNGSDGAPSSAATHLPGEVLAVGDDGLIVACGAGAVLVQEVQPAGRARMTPAEWARGRAISPGARLGV